MRKSRDAKEKKMKTNEQDRLVRAATSFRTWEAMELALRGGYCPTLRRSLKATRQLGEKVEEAGYPVFWRQ
jgi:hypothetical protein